MTFGDTLLATLIGAFVGAVVGALAAWLFAIDLRRRENAESDSTRLDAAVADVVTLLGEAGGAGEALMFAIQLRNPAVPAPPPHMAREQLRSAILAARMAAGRDEGPLLAVYDLVTRRNGRSEDRQAIDSEHAAHLLVQWRQGKVSTADAQARIATRPPRPRTETPACDAPWVFLDLAEPHQHPEGSRAPKCKEGAREAARHLGDTTNRRCPRHDEAPGLSRVTVGSSIQRGVWPRKRLPGC